MVVPSSHHLAILIVMRFLDVERAHRYATVRIATLRSSCFVNIFGWLFCMNGRSQSRRRRCSGAAFSESSWLRLFVIDAAKIEHLTLPGAADSLASRRITIRATVLRRVQSL